MDWLRPCMKQILMNNLEASFLYFYPLVFKLGRKIPKPKLVILKTELRKSKVLALIHRKVVMTLLYIKTTKYPRLNQGVGRERR